MGSIKDKLNYFGGVTFGVALSGIFISGTIALGVGTMVILDAGIDYFNRKRAKKKAAAEHKEEDITIDAEHTESEGGEDNGDSQ